MSRKLVAAMATAMMLICIAGIIGFYSARRDISHLQARFTQLQNKEAVISDRLQGSRKDVITCGDIRDMGLSTTDIWNDDTGFINWNTSPVTLPSHCFNK